MRYAKKMEKCRMNSSHRRPRSALVQTLCQKARTATPLPLDDREYVPSVDSIMLHDATSLQSRDCVQGDTTVVGPNGLGEDVRLRSFRRKS